MRELTVKIHSIEEDGLPDMSNLTGQVAFIWDGAIVSGWPISPEFTKGEVGWWEPSEDRFGGKVTGVTHWVEFPEPTWRLDR